MAIIGSIILTIVILYPGVMAIDAFGEFWGMIVFLGGLGLLSWACFALCDLLSSPGSGSAHSDVHDHSYGSGSYTPMDYGHSNTDAYVKGMQDRYREKQRRERRAESRARSEAYSAARREAKAQRQARSSGVYSASRSGRSAGTSSSRSRSAGSHRGFGGGSSRGGGSGRKF